MKHLKKNLLAVFAACVAAASISGAVFADTSYSTPAEAVAALTGRSLESIITEHQESGKSYGTMAEEAGQLDAFQIAMLEVKQDNLNSLVDAGVMTRTQADTAYTASVQRYNACVGSGHGCYWEDCTLDHSNWGRQNSANSSSGSNSAYGYGSSGYGYGYGHGRHHGGGGHCWR